MSVDSVAKAGEKTTLQIEEIQNSVVNRLSRLFSENLSAEDLRKECIETLLKQFPHEKAGKLAERINLIPHDSTALKTYLSKHLIENLVLQIRKPIESSSPQIASNKRVIFKEPAGTSAKRSKSVPDNLAVPDPLEGADFNGTWTERGGEGDPILRMFKGTVRLKDGCITQGWVSYKKDGTYTMCLKKTEELVK